MFNEIIRAFLGKIFEKNSYAVTSLLMMIASSLTTWEGIVLTNELNNASIIHPMIMAAFIVAAIGSCQMLFWSVLYDKVRPFDGKAGDGGFFEVLILCVAYILICGLASTHFSIISIGGSEAAMRDMNRSLLEIRDIYTDLSFYKAERRREIVSVATGVRDYGRSRYAYELNNTKKDGPHFSATTALQEIGEKALKSNKDTREVREAFESAGENINRMTALATRSKYAVHGMNFTDISSEFGVSMNDAKKNISIIIGGTGYEELKGIRDDIVGVEKQLSGAIAETEAGSYDVDHLRRMRETLSKMRYDRERIDKMISAADAADGVNYKRNILYRLDRVALMSMHSAIYVYCLDIPGAFGVAIMLDFFLMVFVLSVAFAGRKK